MISDIIVYININIIPKLIGSRFRVPACPGLRLVEPTPRREAEPEARADWNPEP